MSAQATLSLRRLIGGGVAVLLEGCVLGGGSFFMFRGWGGRSDWWEQGTDYISGTKGFRKALACSFDASVVFHLLCHTRRIFGEFCHVAREREGAPPHPVPPVELPNQASGALKLCSFPLVPFPR